MSKETKIREKKKPLFIEAISMIVVLLALVIYSVKLDISIIPAMMIAIGWSMVIAYRCGYGWNDIMAPVYEREKGVVEVFFIILLIGAFISTMMFSGTIPVIIYYLINVISPSLMIVLSFLLTAIVSVIIGTSWGTAGTVGVIMLAIAQSMGVPLPIVAGAVASGSHVGQLCSPMADTSNVAASFADVDTMTMIKRMAYYTLPVIGIATVLYAVLGFMNGSGSGDMASAQLIHQEIGSVFNTNVLVILPMVLVFILTFMKKPIVMTLGITSLLGIVFGMIFNGFSFGEGLNALYSGFTVAGSAGIAEEGFSDIFLNLCNRGGATSMVSPAIIVIVASMYGTILMEIKALDVIAETVFSKVKSRVLLSTSAVVLAGLIVSLTSSSFLAGMMPKDLFLKKFEEEGMDSMDLVSAALSASTQYLTCIPWCDIAIFLAGISGVSTLAALPYNFFGWGCSAMVIILSIFGIGYKNGTRMFKLESQKVID